ncbi:MAG: NADPH:quinone reductase [Arcobacter sp.]|nr:MAG: NADPH:quinone reductase [Arcobacter sp.]
MKAIGFKTSHDIEHEQSLIEEQIEKPSAKDYDLIIEVKAASINPIDLKVRSKSSLDKTMEQIKVLGYDGLGIIEALGDKVEGFQIGERVFYAGDVTKNGSNAQYQKIDSRIVAKAPKSLSDAQAVVLPLTSLTAWEAMFHRMNINKDENKTILIIGGAGGVASIAIQLIKIRTNLTVITTASRQESKTWCKSMGADYIVNHKDLIKEVKEAGFEQVDYIFNAADTSMHWNAMAELIAPQGKICLLVDASEPLDINKFKLKSVSINWESMFTRTMFKTEDLKQQQTILKHISKLADEGKIKTTLNKTLKGFSVENIKEAHKLTQSGKNIGKIALTF